MKTEIGPGEVILVSTPIARVTATPGSGDLLPLIIQELRSIRGALSPADRCGTEKGKGASRGQHPDAQPLHPTILSSAQFSSLGLV